MLNKGIVIMLAFVYLFLVGCATVRPSGPAKERKLSSDKSAADVSKEDRKQQLTPVTPTYPPEGKRPDPPFPKCWWGPKPVDKNELISFIKGRGPEYDLWANWLRQHPEDLDWAWGEYKKTN